MAINAQIQKLAEGVCVWNDWRKANPKVQIDLSKINLEYELKSRKLRPSRETHILITSLTGALVTFMLVIVKVSEDKSVVDIVSSFLGKLAIAVIPPLSSQNFYELIGASVFIALKPFLTIILSSVIIYSLIDSIIIHILLGSNIDLSGVDLSEADLRGSSLSNINFNSADLSQAKLEGSNLSFTQLLGANLNGANISGACIEDWNIGSNTKLKELECNFFYSKYDARSGEYLERVPHNKNIDFAPGECEKLLRKAASIVNIIFNHGLDWRAFAYSFSQLQVQYGNDQIAIHSIENQEDGTVIVKLAAMPELDKEKVDYSFWKGYKVAHKVVAGQYKAIISDKNKYINQLFSLLQKSQERLGEVPKIMAENSSRTVIYNQQNSKWGGGFAAEGSIQIGGNLEDLSQHIERHVDEITTLMNSLKLLAQDFPVNHRETTLEHLADLEEDIQTPERRKPSRLKASLAALLATAVSVGGAVATATDFANNIFELSEKLGVPIELTQVPEQLP